MIEVPCTFEDIEVRVLAAIDSWNTGAADRSAAEQARNRAEQERDVALQQRKAASAALVQEQSKRIATEELCSELAAQKKALADALAKEQARCEELAASLSSSKAQNEENRGEIDALKSDKALLQRELAATSDDLTLARSTADELMSLCETQRRELGDIRTSLADAEGARDALISRFSEFGTVAKKDLAALRSGAALQTGLKERAEIGLAEALRQAVEATEEAARVNVERTLLKERVEALEYALTRAEDDNSSLIDRLDQAEKKAAASAVKALKQELSTVKAEAKEAKQTAERLSSKLQKALDTLEKEKASADMARVAAREAEGAEKKLRSAWRAAEDKCHEVNRARMEADAGKRKLMEALVHERSARILAQQELETAAAIMQQEINSNGGNAAAAADVLSSVEKTRLTLLQDEMSGEQKSLSLILEALKEIRAEAEGAPVTPSR
jgi:chromosome segregation ATPase